MKDFADSSCIPEVAVKPYEQCPKRFYKIEFLSSVFHASKRLGDLSGFLSGNAVDTFQSMVWFSRGSGCRFSSIACFG